MFSIDSPAASSVWPCQCTVQVDVQLNNRVVQLHRPARIRRSLAYPLQTCVIGGFCDRSAYSYVISDIKASLSVPLLAIPAAASKLPDKSIPLRYSYRCLAKIVLCQRRTIKTAEFCIRRCTPLQHLNGTTDITITICIRYDIIANFAGSGIALIGLCHILAPVAALY